MFSNIRRQLSGLRPSFYKTVFPSGHFYSPLPDKAQLQEDWSRIFDPKNPGDIGLNPDVQLECMRQIARFHKDWMNFPEQGDAARRYYFPNNFFVKGDALVYAGMLQLYKPKRIIEIGSGFSSALMLDVNAKFLGNSIQATFIDPYPDWLNALLNEKDKQIHTIIAKRVQQVPTGIFAELQAGDIVFVDSSHVSKIGSDLNYILFDVLPVLKPGVVVHFHDILYPFEYPEDWVREGRFWNEAYLLRAFLMNNSDYRIMSWLDYLMKEHRQALGQAYPQLNAGGGSIWLERTA